MEDSQLHVVVQNDGQLLQHTLKPAPPRSPDLEAEDLDSSSVDEITSRTHLAEDANAAKEGIRITHFLRCSSENHPLITIGQLLLFPLWLVVMLLLILYGSYIILRFVLHARKGHLKLNKYEDTGSQADLDAAIASYDKALVLAFSMNGPFIAPALCCMAECLLKRYDRWRHIGDLDVAIGFCQQALLHNPPNELEYRTRVLQNFGTALRFRYRKYGDMKNLEEAIHHFQEALSHQPLGHPDRSLTVYNLAACLDCLYERQSVSRESEMAVGYSQEVLRNPPEDLTRSSILNQVGQCLHGRYSRWGETSDLEDAIIHLREALTIAPVGHADRQIALRGLSTSLSCRYEKFGNAGDADEALDHAREALRLTPIADASRPDSLCILTNALKIPFIRNVGEGSQENLEESILLIREALSTGDSTPALLISLGESLMFLYMEKREIEVLEEAIDLIREGLSHVPVTYHTKSWALYRLFDSLLMRYLAVNSRDDILEAIDLMGSLALQPTGQPDLVMNLRTFCTSYFVLGYEVGPRRGDSVILDKLIHQCRGILLLLSPTDRDRPFCMMKLAECLLSRFGSSHDLRYVDEAINNCQSVLLQPLNRTLELNAKVVLAVCSQYRYDALGDSQDLDMATVCLEDPLWSDHPDHPNQVDRMVFLALKYMSEGGDGDYQEAVDKALNLFQQAVDHPSANVVSRLNASISWSKIGNNTSKILAYQKCLELSDRYILHNPSITSRHQIFKSMPPFLPSDAAARAISGGEYRKAVELLEQGKTIIWSQLTRYRSSLEALMKVDAELAAHFLKLSQRLEMAAIPLSSSVMEKAKISPEEENRTYRRVSREWEETVEKIRNIDGFQTFLKPTPFSVLKEAAKNGPVIIVNVSKLRSDIVIVRNQEEPSRARLRNLRVDDINNLAAEFTAQVTMMQRDGRMQKSRLVHVLRRLWEIIVKPTIKLLQKMGIKRGSRIWWCLTSHLSSLPLHAAGPYKRGELNLPDLYISSYTPTLTALIRASNQKHPSPHSASPTLLLVAQPNTPQKTAIKGVYEEVDKVRQIIPSVELLLDDTGTVKTVQAHLPLHRWIHFACHGSSNLAEPFESQFHLHDGSLKLLDIIAKSLPDAEFAFLSACHSAAGDRDVPDEAINLAAGLQFCGFRSVIGTMYGMVDDDGPFMAEAVYKHMFRRASEAEESEAGPMVDFRDAAEALNIATRALRDTGVPLERWINFVHIGA